MERLQHHVYIRTLLFSCTSEQKKTADVSSAVFFERILINPYFILTEGSALGLTESKVISTFVV